jgi:hypothetical protein
LLAALPAFAQLEIIPDEQPPAVFAGKPQTVRLVVHNKAEKQMDVDVATRLFQATGATAAPVGEAQPWKTVHLLPGQTIIETATFTFPAVRAATRFLVQWGELGRTTALVYPDDLLKGLNNLAGDNPLGVYDPDNNLKPALKNGGVKYADFEIETDDCRFMLVWAKSLPESVTNRLKRGVSVVWVHPTKISFVQIDRRAVGIVVTASPSLLAGLAESPRSQLDLLRMAEAATQVPENNPTVN